MTAKHKNREAWLQAAVEELRPLFAERAGVTLPDVYVACGWPLGASKRSLNRIGECWAGSASADGKAQIFISPRLGDPVKVLDTLVHELVHAFDHDAGHGPRFRRVAVAVGLTGKMASSVAGEELAATLRDISGRLGRYPHGQINVSANAPKKQSTRMLKIQCPCGFVARTTRTWIEDVGLPVCACGEHFELA